jgi:hypothetical protein
LNQTATLPDLQRQVVLSNLAAFAYDPYAIPFHATPSDGTTQIQDNGSIAAQLLVATNRTLTLGLSRTAVDQWSMTPVTDSLALRLLRAAYRRAFDPTVDLYYPDDGLANDLAHELKKQTTTVDDLRTTNQIGNAGLQAYTPATNSSMASSSPHSGFAAVVDVGPQAEATPKIPETVPQALDEGLGKVAEGLNRIGTGLGNLARGPQSGVLLSNKSEPDILGFNNDSIAKFLFESESVLSSNDDRIILEGESLGKSESPLDAQLFQVKLPPWTSERIELPLDEDHPPRDYTITLSDPSRTVPQARIRFADALPEDFRLYDMDLGKPAKVRTALAGFRKLKGLIDAAAQAYYGSIECVASLGIEDMNYTLNQVRKISLVITFPPHLAKYPHKLSAAGAQGFLPSEDYPRYLAVTPLVAELRRQVAEVERTLLKIQPGWVRRSRRKKDIPHDACYQACWKDCQGEVYVWVCPEGRAAFEDFTLAILELSDVIKTVNLSGTTGVKFTPGGGAAALSAGR